MEKLSLLGRLDCIACIQKKSTAAVHVPCTDRVKSFLPSGECDLISTSFHSNQDAHGVEPLFYTAVILCSHLLLCRYNYFAERERETDVCKLTSSNLKLFCEHHLIARGLSSLIILRVFADEEYDYQS